MPSKQVGKYTVGRTLGEGTFGKVKAAVNTETGEHVAIKVIEKEKIQAQELHYQIKKGEATLCHALWPACTPAHACLPACHGVHACLPLPPPSPPPPYRLQRSPS